MKNKKGIQLNQAFGAVLTLVLIGVLLIVGIYMFVSLGTSIPPQSASVSNETGFLNSSGYTLLNSSDCNFANPSVTMRNKSDDTLISSPNYTLSGTKVYNATSRVWNNASISYSYTNGGQTCIANQNMISNFTTYPSLIGLIGTIIFLGIVIGVLVASFVFGGRPSA